MVFILILKLVSLPCESQTVYLGLTYNFGGAKIKKLERKQREENTNQGGGGMF